MSHVASLELCKELYELSGWDNYALTHEWYEPDNPKNMSVYPTYPLDCLLRKLPGSIPGKSGQYAIHLQFDISSGLWIASYGGTGTMRQVLKRSRHPENAACKLAIELFKQGILTKN